MRWIEFGFDVIASYFREAEVPLLCDFMNVRLIYGLRSHDDLGDLHKSVPGTEEASPLQRPALAATY
jgi:hypothetical protein